MVEAKARKVHNMKYVAVCIIYNFVVELFQREFCLAGISYLFYCS